MSVRGRLTLVVGLLVAAVAATAAIAAPSLVEDALVDDILDAEAESQAFFFDELGFLSGLPLLDDLSQLVEPGQVIDQLGSDRLDELIDIGGKNDLVVALGGDKFVRVDASGMQTIESIEPKKVDQPVLSFLELFDGVAGPPGFFDSIPTEVEEAVFGDEFIDRFDDSGRVVTEVKEVEGIKYFVSGQVDSVDRTVSRVRTALWLLVPFAVALAVVVTWVLAGRALRPVRAITDQASTISGGTLSERVPVPSSGDEIATLATTVNGMLDRLEADDRRRRRFISDASHELRTPVAVLKSEAEVALRSPDGTDVAVLAGGVLDESTRLAAIIDDLLALARHDEQAPPTMTDIDLDDIVLAEAARQRRVPVDVSAVSAGRVTGRVDEFTRVVAHLLDNAARHASGRVVVGLSTTVTTVELVVDDDGPGVAVGDREAIFERFTRLDEARTRDAGGAGLGLAVVASVVARSGGDIVVETSDLGGARFRVTFPVG